jgi:chromosomal replication initiator protein
MTNQQLWQAILGHLEIALSKANFNTWFKNTCISEKEGDKITVQVPDFFHKNWISGKYHAEMLKALKAISPEIKEIRYQVTGQALSSANTQTKQSIKNDTQTFSQKEAIQNTGGINPKYTFETFVIGKNNELAHAASLAVAKTPGSQYNPLFLYGGVGLGKTHLMHAVGHKLLQNNPRVKILYSTSEKFTNDYINSISQKKTDEFKKFYRNVDALLIDDVQFLAGKEGTQEEFFHTFNELRDKGKQIILTSDRPPKEIPAIEQRLISRFEWGMLADIQAPNMETRMAILRNKMEKKGATIPEDILFYIAENIQNNVRELEGALNKLAVYQQMENKILVLDQAKNILASIVGSKKRISSPKKIAETVSVFYNISNSDLIKESRKKEFVKPRQIAMYIIRKELDISFPSIGEFFGGRDHTTVMHAVEKINSQLEKNESFKQEIGLIMDKLFTT